MKLLQNISKNLDLKFGFLSALLVKIITFFGYLYFFSKEEFAVSVSFLAKIFFTLGAFDFFVFTQTYFIGGLILFFIFLFIDNRKTHSPGLSKKIIYFVLSYLAINTITITLFSLKLMSQSPSGLP